MRVHPTVLMGLLATAAACGGKSDPVMVPGADQPAPTATQQAPNPVRASPSPATSPVNNVPARPSDAPSLPLGSVSYRCDGGSQVQANYVSGMVAIRWNGRVHDLTVDPTSTDRTLYKSASYQWRLEGKDGTLIERGREVATDCEPQ